MTPYSRLTCLVHMQERVPSMHCWYRRVHSYNHIFQARALLQPLCSTVSVAVVSLSVVSSKMNCSAPALFLDLIATSSRQLCMISTNAYFTCTAANCAIALRHNRTSTS